MKTLGRCVAAVTFVLFGCCGLVFGVEQGIERADVFVAGQKGYHTFRIPAVVVSPDKSLLAFCEGRKSDRRDHGDIDLVLKRSGDGGKTWGPLAVVYEEGGSADITIGNPCPVTDNASATIWLPFCRDNRDVLVTRSVDNGKTWSKPRDITADVKKAGWGWYATGPGVGIQLCRELHRGRLVIPCDHRETIDGREVMVSHVFYSDDSGQSWKLGGSVDKHTDECQVVELVDGRLMINMRNYWGRDGKMADRGGMRAVAFSSDGGETWGELQFDKTLIEPICQASLIAYPKPQAEAGRGWLLFSNPASKTTRERLTIRLSKSDGRDWPLSRMLYEGPSAYSCLTLLSDGEIGCLYEAGHEHANEKIVFARFPVDSLK